MQSLLALCFVLGFVLILGMLVFATLLALKEGLQKLILPVIDGICDLTMVDSIVLRAFGAIVLAAVIVFAGFSTSHIVSDLLEVLGTALGAVLRV
jgi:hypothetical protein